MEIKEGVDKAKGEKIIEAYHDTRQVVEMNFKNAAKSVKQWNEIVTKFSEPSFCLLYTSRCV